MYRSEREVLLAKLREVAEEQALRDAEVVDKQQQEALMRQSQNQARRIRWSSLIGLGAYVAVAVVYVVATRATTRDTLARQLERREVAAKALADREAIRDNQLAALRTVSRDHAQLQELYGALRYKDANDLTDAWVIVGAVSCERRDRAGITQANAELAKAGSTEGQAELSALCSLWANQP